MVVESRDIQDLPEKGEAIYINKTGQRIRFVDGNFPGKYQPKPEQQEETITVP